MSYKKSFIYSLAIAVFSLSIFFACKEDDEVEEQEEEVVNPEDLPQINNIDPVSAGPGERVTLNGANFRWNDEIIELKLESLSVEIPYFTDESITAVIPEYAQSGKFNLTMGEHTTESPGFEVLPVPRVLGFSSDTTCRYDTLTIEGYNFSNNKEDLKVFFNLTDSLEAEIIDSSPEEIRVIVPGLAMTGNISVQNNEYEGLSLNSLAIVGLSIQEVIPPSAKVLETIVIRGTSFSSALEENHVTIDGVDAEIISASNKELEVEVPVGAYRGPIEVTTGELVTTSTEEFSVIQPENKIVGESNKFGISIKCNGNFAIIATGNFPIQSSFHVFEYDQEEWFEINEFSENIITTPTLALTDEFLFAGITNRIIHIFRDPSNFTKFKELEYSSWYKLGTFDASNRTMAVAGNPEYSNSALDIYEWDDTDWVLKQQIIEDIEYPDRFGAKVIVKDDQIAVSVPNYHENGSSGAIFVYEKINNSWIKSDSILNSENPDFNLGWWFDFQDGVFVAGDPYDNDNSGAVYIYRNNGVSWSKISEIVAEDSQPGDFFGSSIVIENDFILIGAYGHQNRGAAYLFWDPNFLNFELIQKFGSEDSAEGDQFGNSIDMSQQRIFIGAPGDDNAKEDSGSAYYYFY